MGIIVLLVMLLFNLLGNTADVHLFSRSSLVWMTERWKSYGGQYSHCWLLPFVSLGVLWLKRAQLASVKKKTDPRAIILIIAALLLQIISARSRLPRLSLVSFICLLWSIPWYLYGWQIARILIFPCAYLFLCIPLTFLDSLTFPLRLLAASTSVFLLNGMGVECFSYGTAIISSAPGGIALDVADPCSGLRYFLVMISLFAAYGYLTQKTLLKKWLVFLVAAPLAIVANIVRIVAIAIVATMANTDIAVGIYHDYSGYIVFITAVLLMIGFGSLININYKEKWQKLIKNK